MQPAYLTPHCVWTVQYNPHRPHRQGLGQRRIKHLVASQGAILARLRPHQGIGTVRAKPSLLNDTFVPLENIHSTMLWVLATQMLTSLQTSQKFNITHNQPPKTNSSTCESENVTLFPLTSTVTPSRVILTIVPPFKLSPSPRTFIVILSFLRYLLYRHSIRDS